MRKWTKPLLAIAILLVVGGSCFYLGDILGNRKGYTEGMAEQALAAARVHSREKVLLLKFIRGEAVSKITAERLLEVSLESDILSIEGLDTIVPDDGAGKILMKNVADYIKGHPLKVEPVYQNSINDFINKYGTK